MYRVIIIIINVRPQFIEENPSSGKMTYEPEDMGILYPFILFTLFFLIGFFGHNIN